MPSTKVTLFSQVLGLLKRSPIQKIVREHESDKHSKGINTWTQMISMIFMQMSGCNSLRDISMGLRSATGNLLHMGIKKAPSKSSLSYLNKNRSHEVFKAIYFDLLERYGASLNRSRMHARRIKKKVFIMDSSIIPLSLSLFDWAKYRTTKGAVKLHAVLDYDSGLPCYANLSDGKKHDVKVAKETLFPEGSVLVVDRAYVDYEWLYNLDSNGVSFVTRLKSNAVIEVLEEFLTNEKQEHILSDHDIQMAGLTSSKKYPKTLRIVRVYDEKRDQYLILLTNHLSWTADTVSQLYKARWDIEVFFKHIKQLFRVKTFVGTSPNAVRIQMWCAMIAMLLLSYLKQKAKYPWGLSNLITFIRTNLFVKIDLWKWVNKPTHENQNLPPPPSLFE